MSPNDRNLQPNPSAMDEGRRVATGTTIVVAILDRRCLMKNLIFICTAFLVFWLLPHSSPAQTVEKFTAEHFSDFIVACRLGDQDTVVKLLKQGAPLEESTSNDWTPLIHACDAGQDEIAQLLIKEGANVNVMGRDDQRPLNAAIRAANLSTVKKLLDKGAHIKSNLREFRDPVISAIIWNNIDALKELESRGARSDTWKTPYHNPLTLAAYHRNLEMVKYLIDKGHNPNKPNPQGNFPLAVATFQKDGDVIDLLIKNGSEVNQVNLGAPPITDHSPYPHTALFAAVRTNNPELVKKLLSAGADPNVLAGQALRFADLQGNEKIYNLLIKAGGKAPSPYSFTTDPSLDMPPWFSKPEQDLKAIRVDWDLAAILNEKIPSKNDSSSIIPSSESKTLAILPLGENLENATALLTAALSQQSGIDLIEREEINRIFREQKLTLVQLSQPEQLIRSGQLLGAEFLLLISEQDGATVARLTSSTTSLTLAALFREKDADLEAWCTEAAETFSDQLIQFSPDIEKTSLISIPAIAGATYSIENRLLAEQFSLAISHMLGRQPGIYLLERKNMDHLHLEKTIRQETRNYYSSGWLLDGSFEDIPPSEYGNLSLTLRMRKVQGGEEIRMTHIGHRDSPAPLLKTAISEVIRHLNRKEVSAWDPIKEAEAYLLEAKRAMNAGLWSQAYHAATSAWALGLGSDEVTRLRLLSLIYRINFSDNVILKQKVWKLRGEARFMANQAPLLVPSQNERELSAAQYIELTNSALSLSESIIGNYSPETESEIQTLWMMPDMIRVMNSPLRLLSSLSDEKTYHEELDDLRTRLFQLTNEGLALCRQNDYHGLYQRFFLCRLHHLPYWIRDEEKLAQETLLALEEAAEMKAPLSRHDAFHAIMKWANPHWRTFGGRTATYWQRIAPFCLESQNDDIRLLGMLAQRYDTSSWSQLHQLLPPILEIIEKLAINDDTVIGSWNSYFGSPEPEINASVAFIKWPDARNWAWYPSPFQNSYRSFTYQDDPVFGILNSSYNCPTKLNNQSRGAKTRRLENPEQFLFYENIFKQRLETIRKSGAAVMPFASTPVYSTSFMEHLINTHEDPNQLLSNLQDAEQAISNRLKDYPYLDGNGKRFNSYYVKIYSKILREQALVKKMVSPSQPPIKPQPPQTESPAITETKKESTQPPFMSLENFRSPLLEIPNVPNDFLRPLSQRHMFNFIQDAKEGIWLNLNKAGFVFYDKDMNLSDVVWVPEGEGLLNQSQDGHYISDHFIVADINRPKRKGDNPEWHNGIGLFDLKTRKWKFFNIEDSPGEFGIKQTLIFNDQIIYSFIKNPDIVQRWGTSSLNSDPDTTFGIMQLDISTGKETILVSNRRSPPANPLDGMKGGNGYQIMPLSENELLCRSYVYDLLGKTWSKPNPEQSKRSRSFEMKFWTQGNGFSVSPPNISRNSRIIEARLRFNNKEEKIFKGKGIIPPETLFIQTDLKPIFDLKIPRYLKGFAADKQKFETEPSTAANLFCESGFIMHNSLGFAFYTWDEYKEIAQAAFDQMMRDFVSAKE